MLLFLCRKLPHVRRTGHLTVSILGSISDASLKSISTSTDEPSFTASYLIHSCGLSKEAAVSASKRVQFESSQKPDLILSFFGNHGFTHTQITKLIKGRPPLLLSDPDKTLKPKFEFFYSIGVSPPDLAKILSSNPIILGCSLKNQLIPSFEFLKSLVHTDQNVVKVLKRWSKTIVCSVQNFMVPNISFLRDQGVPEPMISMLLLTDPRALMRRPDQFNEIVMKIKEMGFDPLKSKFILAIRAMTGLSKSTWEGKLDVFRRWGWSEEEVLSAFRRQPQCVMVSEKKVMKGMDFFVNTMNLESSVIARHIDVLMLSLEKTIIPRCSVIQVLLSKGLIEKDFSISTVLKSREKYFLKKFVTKYQREVPQLLKVDNSAGQRGKHQW